MHAVMGLNIISGAVVFFMATHSDLYLYLLSLNIVWDGNSLRVTVGYRDQSLYYPTNAQRKTRRIN